MRLKKREPNFENIQKILRNGIPDRPTLFEFILGNNVCQKLTGLEEDGENKNAYLKMQIKAFERAGYDYYLVPTWHTDTLVFPKGKSQTEKSRSQNEGALITDRESFEKYEWPDPDMGNYDIYSELGKQIPDGMKLIACGYGGVLENATDIVGYENLCMISMMDEEFTKSICDEIGSRLLKFYEIVSSIDSVGAIISNDDWGFKSQTMFAPEMLKKFIFPWHKKILESAHKNGKPVILHSCGNLSDVMDDIIEEIKFDGKHSYEDEITPVEEAYELWGNRIAILGGIDVDYISRNTPLDIYKRSKEMLERTDYRGGYGLGSGNSIPDYVPFDNYLAMIKAIHE